MNRRFKKLLCLAIERLLRDEDMQDILANAVAESLRNGYGALNTEIRNHCERSR